MKLRTKLTLLFALIFSTLIILLNTFMYYRFSNMRKEEFYLRLQEKSENTLRLLADVDDIDHELLRIIDQNTIDALYEEKTLIFDGDFKLIYSSLDDHPVNYSPQLLAEIKEKGEVFFTDEVTQSEVLGSYRIFGDEHSYIVLSTAYDRYGIEELEDILNILLLASLMGIIIAVLLGYWIIYQGFRPLEVLNANIKNITEQNLNLQVPVKTGAKDEFSELANSYNQMLLRLADAFERQKTFVQHASHELRTPVSAMMSQVEVAIKEEAVGSDRHTNLSQMLLSLDKISDLINSLLLLSKVQDRTDNKFIDERIDEIIFSAAETVAEHFPEFKPVINFSGAELSDDTLQFPAHRYLMKILFINLMENAYKYSSEGRVEVDIRPKSDGITITFTNSGNTVSASDQKKLFTPFFRTQYVSAQPGHGLGLSIAERVATYHGAELFYSIQNGLNVFTVELKKQN
jgi:two-component system sensor histidine kinase ArlS